MSDTHINAFIQETRERLQTVEAALRDANDSLDALIAKTRGESPAPTEPAEEPNPANEGDAQAKTKKVKYR